MRHLSIATLLVVGLYASASSAQENNKLNDSGTVIISAERLSPLFAYNKSSLTRDDPAGEITTSTTRTSSSLIANPSPGSFANIPRFAFDYVAGPGVTIGASAMLYFTFSAKNESERGSTSVSEDDDETTALGIMPRLGYIVPLGNMASFWPRVGFSYTHISVDSPERTTAGVTTSNSLNQSMFGLHIEPLFTISPINHFAFTLGPVVDIPLSGTTKAEQTRNGVTTSEKGDSSQFHVGVTAGMLGHF